MPLKELPWRVTLVLNLASATVPEATLEALRLVREEPSADRPAMVTVPAVLLAKIRLLAAESWTRKAVVELVEVLIKVSPVAPTLNSSAPVLFSNWKRSDSCP